MRDEVRKEGNEGRRWIGKKEHEVKIQGKERESERRGGEGKRGKRRKGKW